MAARGKAQALGLPYCHKTARELSFLLEANRLHIPATVNTAVQHLIPTVLSVLHFRHTVSFEPTHT